MTTESSDEENDKPLLFTAADWDTILRYGTSMTYDQRKRVVDLAIFIASLKERGEDTGA